MRLVDKYLTLSKQCRESAKAAPRGDVKKQYAELAQIWETMAKERLRLLQLQTDVMGPPGKREP